ncbi:MAG: hypothetical protein ACRDJ4_13670 [Actinomycetota bacterium]
MLRCGLCRRAFVGTSKGRSRRYHYCICSTRYRYGTDHCSADRLPSRSWRRRCSSRWPRSTRTAPSSPRPWSRPRRRGPPQRTRSRDAGSGPARTGIGHQGAGSLLRRIRGGEPLAGGLSGARQVPSGSHRVTDGRRDPPRPTGPAGRVAGHDCRGCRAMGR